MQHIDLLWTGGWDSTFRLLEAVLQQRLTVQPHYVIDDPPRPSTDAELAAMARIRAGALLLDPAAEDRILPTVVQHRTAVPRDEQIRQAYKAVMQQVYIGGQYVWLAEYALSKGIRLELAIHVDDRAHLAIKDHIESVDDGSGSTYAVRPGDDSPNAILFRQFRFPILRLSKLDMQARATEHGYAHLLEETWFCHTPRAGKPCGLCAPCQFAIQEGLGRRVPANRRLLYRVLAPYLRAKTLAARWRAR